MTKTFLSLSKARHDGMLAEPVHKETNELRRHILGKCIRQEQRIANFVVISIKLLELINYRFANIFKLSNYNLDEMWKIIRKIKSTTIFDKRCTNYFFEEKEDKLNQVLAVEQFLGINSTAVEMENLTVKEIKDAAEMFIYLQICPGKLFDVSKFDNSMPNIGEQYKSWFIFYRELFTTRSPNEIILTINRLINSQIEDDKKFIHRKLLKRISSLMNLKYEDIQRITPRVDRKNHSKGIDEPIGKYTFH